jgi:hypothetical protein
VLPFVHRMLSWQQPAKKPDKSKIDKPPCQFAALFN